MLYNKDTKAIKKPEDCLHCPHFDRKLKKCRGVGKVCFEYDPKINTAIDPVTKMPIRFN